MRNWIYTEATTGWMAHPEEEAGDAVLAMDVLMATGLL